MLHQHCVVVVVGVRAKRRRPFSLVYLSVGRLFVGTRVWRQMLARMLEIEYGAMIVGSATVWESR